MHKESDSNVRHILNNRIILLRFLSEMFGFIKKFLANLSFNLVSDEFILKMLCYNYKVLIWLINTVIIILKIMIMRAVYSERDD